MNDRQQPLSMPKFQAGFISAIVLPLYETLARVPVLTSALEGTFYRRRVYSSSHHHHPIPNMLEPSVLPFVCDPS